MKNKEITDILLYVGIAPEKKGFTYLQLVLELMCQDNTTLKEAYKKVTLSHHIHSCTIDSSIRNVIHAAYESGKMERLNKRLGIDILDTTICPTNKAFISYVVQCLNYSTAV